MIDLALGTDLGERFAEAKRILFEGHESAYQRLIDGHDEYDNSWSTYTPAEVVREIEEEADDLVTWSTILAALQPDTPHGKRVVALARAIASHNLAIRTITHELRNQIGAAEAHEAEQQDRRTECGMGPEGHRGVAGPSPEGEASALAEGPGDLLHGARLPGHGADHSEVVEIPPRGRLGHEVGTWSDAEWYGPDDI